MSKDCDPIARQGTNDGLSGIYCLINAIRDDDRLKGSSGKDILRYLLEAASRLNNLLPAKISNGYEAHELTDIFNEFARSLNLSWRAGLLIKVRHTFPLFSPTIVSKRILEEGGKIILRTEDCDHWLLAYMYNFGKHAYLVEDPDLEHEKTKISSKKVTERGVVILPTRAHLARAL